MDEDKSIQLLAKHASDTKAYKAVLAHSKSVQKIALKIAKKVKENGIEVDIDFVKSACILHDIGRFECPPWKDSIKHGVAGAKILHEECIDERYARVCERHLGGGITTDDVKQQGLPIPAKNYMPETVEEKIICYADCLVDDDKEIPVEQAINRFTTEISKAAGEKIRKLHDDIQMLMGRLLDSDDNT